ncbi:MAG: hypothetical protein ACPIOQ_55990 [Promethearchaeia archaeon]
MPALGEASASDDPTQDVASASLSASPERTDSFLRASAIAGPGDSNASLYFSTVSHVPRRGDCLADTAVSQDFSSVQRSREHGGESEMDAAAGADAPGTYTGLTSSPVVGSEACKAARSPRRSRGFQLPSEGDGADPSLAEENLSRAINSSLNLSQLDPLRLDDVLCRGGLASATSGETSRNGASTLAERQCRIHHRRQRRRQGQGPSTLAVG